MFAIKQNMNENYKLIENECRILSRLNESDHIIKFLGAVIDEGELPTQPPLVCKMMMELAESKIWQLLATAINQSLFILDGNLAEMLTDEYGEEAPLPQDQSLYYLQQILKGVNFLHQSGYLHLNIKGDGGGGGGCVCVLCVCDHLVIKDFIPAMG